MADARLVSLSDGRSSPSRQWTAAPTAPDRKSRWTSTHRWSGRWSGRNLDGDSPAWRAEALEHGFELTTAAHRLRGEEYVGPSLDWHGVDLVAAAPAAPTDSGVRQVVPTQLVVPGAPHPRWWRLEDPDIYLDSPHDPEPSVLSVLLPELNYVDVNDWYVLPLAQRAGTMRRITELTVVDSFGIVTELPALGADGWQVFTLTPGGDDVDTESVRGLLFVPHTAISVLTNDPVEDVRFHRDEQANLVWAVEYAYRDENGELVQGGDSAARRPQLQPAADAPPRYRFVAGTPPQTWIPYLPRAEVGTAGAVTGLHLRRGRTDPDATRQRPQHRTRVVAESWRLGEHEVPPEGVRVRRAHRYARGSDGGTYFWVGRRVEPAPASTLPHSAFDVVVPGPA